MFPIDFSLGSLRLIGIKIFIYTLNLLEMETLVLEAKEIETGDVNIKTLTYWNLWNEPIVLHCMAHLAYCVHKSGHKTSIIIITLYSSSFANIGS